jgi:hypothetical protein
MEIASSVALKLGDLEKNIVGLMRRNTVEGGIMMRYSKQVALGRENTSWEKIL